jgi:hypothetical protein
MTNPNAVSRTYTQHIHAPASVVFPLLCPVREAEWLDGWNYELLHSQSGYAEEGCVFRTTPPGDPETIWVVTRHDRDAGVVEFTRVTAGLVATRLAVRIEDRGASSDVVVTYRFTPTSEAGARFVAERHSEEAFRGQMDWWERSMNHYVATGSILRRSES